jgi:hypothetical protein
MNTYPLVKLRRFLASGKPTSTGRSGGPSPATFKPTRGTFAAACTYRAPAGAPNRARAHRCGGCVSATCLGQYLPLRERDLSPLASGRR